MAQASLQMRLLTGGRALDRRVRRHGVAQDDAVAHSGVRMAGNQSESPSAAQDDVILRAAERLRRGLQRDPRTGLLQFSGDRFAEALDVVVAEFTPAAVPLSIVLADLDGMHVVNANHGYDAGDEVLSAVGHALPDVVRPLDVVMTTGSDGFLLVLLGGDAGVAAARAEQARAAVAQLVVPQVPTGVRASFGVATHLQGERSQDLFERAFSAEQQAKALGRDRVEVAPAP